MVKLMRKQILIVFLLLTFLMPLFLSYKTLGNEIDIPSTADSYVDSYTSNDNYGSSPELIVGYMQTKYSAARISIAYLMFDISFLSSKSKVEFASLSFYVSAIKEIGSIYIYFSSDVSWEENKITWVNAPSYGNTPINTIIISTPMKHYVIDITSAINSALTENIKKFTLILAPKQDVEASYFIQLYSKESPIEEYKPKLKLVYSMEEEIKTSTQTVWSIEFITTIVTATQTVYKPNYSLLIASFVLGFIIGITSVYLIKAARKHS